LSDRLDGASIVAVYARWAPVYDRIFGVITRKAILATMERLNRLPPSRILENGVGTGISLPHYDKRHAIVGVDLSPDMLERARARVGADNLDNVESLEVMDALDLRFGDGSFDVAVAMFVMTVVPDSDRALAEMIRVVKPGGRIVITNHYSADRGARAWFERWLSRYSAKLGWHPEFDIERVMGRVEMKLVERKSLSPMGIYTLLVFERL